jgi:DNA-binding response OmpR family regulator
VSSRILVIEDDPDAALFATHVLTTRGQFEVVHTADPASALRLVLSEPWSLVLTDMELPGVSGLELLRALRSAAPDLPVAVLTAEPLDYALSSALASVADAILTKPVPIDRLVAVVTALARSSRA